MKKILLILTLVLWSCAETPETEFSELNFIPKDNRFYDDQNEPYNGIIFKKHWNDQLAYKTLFVNGRPDGESIIYFDNGNIESKGYYENGLLQGKYLMYHYNGTLEEESFFQDGKLEGNKIRYDSDGIVVSEGTFINGVAHGMVYLYEKAENGLNYLTYTAEMENGLKNGLETFYFPESFAISSTTNYKDDISNGEYFEYNENGEIVKEGLLKNGERVGDWNAYKNGLIISTVKHSDNGGKDFFIYYSYHEDGVTLKSKESHYVDPTGQLIDHGISYEYHENGNVKIKRNYKDGLLDGLNYIYYEDGKKEFEALFKDGEVIERRGWDKNGEEIL